MLRVTGRLFSGRTRQAVVPAAHAAAGDEVDGGAPGI